MPANTTLEQSLSPFSHLARHASEGAIETLSIAKPGHGTKERVVESGTRSCDGPTTLTSTTELPMQVNSGMLLSSKPKLALVAECCVCDRESRPFGLFFSYIPKSYIPTINTTWREWKLLSSLPVAKLLGKRQHMIELAPAILNRKGQFQEPTVKNKADIFSTPGQTTRKPLGNGKDEFRQTS